MHRRTFIALLACFPALRPQAAEQAVRLSENEVEADYENEMYTGRFSFFVAVPPDVAWEVLTDFDHMHTFVPNLEASRTLSRDERFIQVAQRGKMDFGPFTFRFESERRIEARRQEGVLISRAVSGSAKHMQSEMRVTPEKSGTRLDYRVEMIPGRWIPSGIGTSFLRHELAEQFSAMAAEMLRRHRGRRSNT